MQNGFHLSLQTEEGQEKGRSQNKVDDMDKNLTSVFSVSSVI